MSWSPDIANERAYNRFRRWLISSHDFSIAVSAGNFLLDDLDDEKTYTLEEIRRLKCYETALIIAYARPFAMAKGPVGNLSCKDLGIGAGDVFWPLHQRLMHLRNTLYGHSDAEHVRFRVYYSLIDDGRPDAPLFLPRFAESLALAAEEVATVRDQLLIFIHALAQKSYPLAPKFQERFKVDPLIAPLQ
jgi:hypothetical protein